MTIKSIFITFDSRMPLNVCDCFLFAVLKISKRLVFLFRKKIPWFQLQFVCIIYNNATKYLSLKKIQVWTGFKTTTCCRVLPTMISKMGTDLKVVNKSLKIVMTLLYAWKLINYYSFPTINYGTLREGGGGTLDFKW